MNTSLTLHLKELDKFKVDTVLVNTNYLEIEGGRNTAQIFFYSLGQMKQVRDTLDEFLATEEANRELARRAMVERIRQDNAEGGQG